MERGRMGTSALSAVEEERVGQYSPSLLKAVRAMRAENLQDIGTNAMEEFIHISQRMDTEAAIYLFTNRFPEPEQWAVEQHLNAEAHRIAEELGAS